MLQIIYCTKKYILIKEKTQKLLRIILTKVPYNQLQLKETIMKSNS